MGDDYALIIPCNHCWQIKCHLPATIYLEWGLYIFISLQQQMQFSNWHVLQLPGKLQLYTRISECALHTYVHTCIHLVD